MQATQRLYLTGDKKTLVAHDHAKAATLYCVPGDEIPQSAADRFGLVEGGLKGGPKEGRPGRDKEDKGGKDKDGAGGGVGGGSGDPGKPSIPAEPANGVPIDDLTKLKGVGPATAKAFAGAGVTTFASIAAIDPANPPAIGGLPVHMDWAGIVAAATAAVDAAGLTAKNDQG